ncbi:putative 4-hydroxy-4-methyl-2-oxoglutarate aldolase [Candidatus Sororendozoicomonas aggregata]|uniref:putative 4-hydroxy-4-methyl-2-oxoglutarate aldolase n=1 Tax=Candidatus Sororendozoicomonas aggregata TaxID=3073239 RepID=UPI002ED2A605
MLLTTPDLCDQYPGEVAVLDLPLRHFGGITAFSGVIVTIKCFEDNSLVREQVLRGGKGNVLVIDGGGSLKRALLGDRLAEKAVSNGWSGIIINGCVRDVEILSILSLGVMALGSHPMKTEKKGAGEYNCPVTVGGVDIHPGSWVYADGNGVLISDRSLH